MTEIELPKRQRIESDALRIESASVANAQTAAMRFCMRGGAAYSGSPSLSSLVANTVEAHVADGLLDCGAASECNAGWNYLTVGVNVLPDDLVPAFNAIPELLREHVSEEAFAVALESTASEQADIERDGLALIEAAAARMSGESPFAGSLSAGELGSTDKITPQLVDQWRQQMMGLAAIVCMSGPHFEIRELMQNAPTARGVGAAMTIPTEIPRLERSDLWIQCDNEETWVGCYVDLRDTGLDEIEQRLAANIVSSRFQALARVQLGLIYDVLSRFVSGILLVCTRVEHDDAAAVLEATQAAVSTTQFSVSGEEFRAAASLERTQFLQRLEGSDDVVEALLDAVLEERHLDCWVEEWTRLTEQMERSSPKWSDALGRASIARVVASAEDPGVRTPLRMLLARDAIATDLKR